MKIGLPFAALAFLLGAGGRAEILPQVIEAPFAAWSVHGDPELFNTGPEGLAATWDSTKANSFIYYPLGTTLTRSSRFALHFQLRLASIGIGTTPGKPYTFPIAAGLINTTNAADPQLQRGAGIHAVHGIRNVVEWAYFPDSGFGATIAPAIATAANQIAYSHNFPLELAPGELYRFELSFTPEDQTLRTRMWRGSQGPERLKDVVLDGPFTDFRVNAVAVSSYSDEGQTAPFAGSILAAGLIPALRVVVFDRPRLRIEPDRGQILLEFETAPGWSYWIESSEDLVNWRAEAGPLTGAGPSLRSAAGSGRKFFRVRGERSP